MPQQTRPDRTVAAYVRTAPPAPVAPPMAAFGPLRWIKDHLLSSVFNSALTVLIIALLVWIVPPLVKFLVIDAVWSGADREACLATPARPEVGACWAFVREWFSFFIYGPYPADQRWRVDVFFGLLAFGIGWLLWLDAPRRDLGALFFFAILPLVSVALLRGFPPLGLSVVDTASWGGLLVTLVVAAVGIVVSLPIGVLLALGRRSKMPAVKLISVLFIEFVRGVPLITVLFMASVMLPLFLPEGWTIDKLVRALIMVALFSAAYLAEVIRGGLQAIPRGQYEAADALGLTYWQKMGLIILPQALKLVIPGIVNTFIGLFKDTSLVLIIGIFDLLGIVQQNLSDANWFSPNTPMTGYVFAGVIFWLFCFGMSRYSMFVERRLAAGERR